MNSLFNVLYIRGGDGNFYPIRALKGDNGATFTPTVSAAGVISWTNDGGLPNPQAVNIRGPQGEDGTKSVLSATQPSSQNVGDFWLQIK